MKFFAVVLVVFAAFVSLASAVANGACPTYVEETAQWDQASFLPDTCDCTKYYMCVTFLNPVTVEYEYVPLEMPPCTGGLYWNNDKKVSIIFLF